VKKVVKARLQWLSPEEGGRKHPPAGPRYSTVARFEDAAARFPEIAWSFVVEFDAPISSTLEVTANVWMLAYDEPGAPQHLLEPGNRFELVEGAKVVARGYVLGE
jgi:hypothetical protein